MPRRVRDYAAEYARRKALHPGDITRARGHHTRERESVERRMRTLMRQEGVRVDDQGNIIRRGTEGGRRPSLKGVITNENYRQLDEMLKEQKKAARAYERGEPYAGQRQWRERDRSLPEWMFWYHGIFG